MAKKKNELPHDRIVLKPYGNRLSRGEGIPAAKVLTKWPEKPVEPPKHLSKSNND